VCALEGEVEFLNRLYVEAARPILIGDIELYSHRKSHQERVDEAEVNAKEYEIDDSDRDVVYHESLDHLRRLNIAFKTLQVLGQVLRNFPNVLRANLKTRAASACYSLGLRVMSAIFLLTEEHLQALREYFAVILMEHKRIDLESRLANDSDSMTIRMMGGFSQGIIRRIAEAVGSEELGETYRNVLRSDGEKTSVSLIDLAIKMEHFAFPESEVEQIYKKVKQNRFSYSLLRELVLQHLILNDVGLPERRKLGRLLQIEVREITDGSMT
jgi:hypothetical protein